MIGCSPVGDWIAASFIDLIGTVPHEIGHSLGLRHDPCRGCSPPAQDPDPNYPQYNSFNSDSIGTFGFDPTTNTVFNPSSAIDFMTAFLPAIPWISPYRHQGLLGPALGGGSMGGGMTLLGGDIMTLFLGLEIDRDRSVERRISFHYGAVMQGTSRCESEFTFQFLGSKREVLDCGPLHCLCEPGDCNCWPKTIRDALPLPPGAAWFGVLEGDKTVYEEAIPSPPKIRVTGQSVINEGVRVTWQSKEAQAYLVHYWDDRAGVWRGAAPRTEQTSWVVPMRLFRHGQTLRVATLGSSGIATGYAEVELKSGADRLPPEGTIGLVGLEPRGDGPRRMSSVVRAVATDPAGSQVDEGESDLV